MVQTQEAASQSTVNVIKTGVVLKGVRKKEKTHVGFDKKNQSKDNGLIKYKNMTPLFQ